MSEIPNKEEDSSSILVQKGDILGEKYRILQKIGDGAMGTVYKCEHLELSGRILAIKVLKPEIVKDSKAIERFKNEVITAYDVNHENVVRAYDYINEGPIVAYTMEFVEGGDLSDKIYEKELLTIDQTIRYLAEMCKGVQALHYAKIVHRDIKPENVLISKDDKIKISDFGIALLDRESRLTQDGGIVGTANYVSPEYMINGQIDSRSDIYALGLIAYEMLTGKDAFPGDNMYIRMRKRMTSDAKSPLEERPECPKPLGRIVLKALAKEPELRYQSCNEILADLMLLMTPEQKLISGVFEMPQTESELYSAPVKTKETKTVSGSLDSKTWLEINKFHLNQKDLKVEEKDPSEIRNPQLAQTRKNKKINADIPLSEQARKKEEQAKEEHIKISSAKKSGIYEYYNNSSFFRNSLKYLVTALLPIGIAFLSIGAWKNNIKEVQVEEISKQVPIQQQLSGNDNYADMQVKGTVIVKHNKVVSINILALPKNINNSDVKIEKVVINHQSIYQKPDGTIIALGEAKATLITKDGLKNVKTEAKIDGDYDFVNKKLTLNFQAPKQYATSKDGINFLAKKSNNNKYIYFIKGSLDIPLK